MKNLANKLFIAIVLISISSWTSAAMIDITDPTATHFANFTNISPAGDFSVISNDTPASTYGDLGWHDSPSATIPGIAGIILDTQYVVTGLRLQTHINPFKNFILQGSNDTSDGMDGNWNDIISSTVTNRTELAWQEWSFVNRDAYSSYRIYATDAYISGWAMHRWELLADDSNTAIAEPHMGALFGLCLLGLAAYRRVKA